MARFTRKAILIASSPENQKRIPGVYVDLNRWKEFLLSPYGGAWLPKEIIPLADPTDDEFEDARAAASTCDFSLVAFSGHGEQTEDGHLICLNSDSDVNVRELNPLTPRTLLIIDSCRLLKRRKMVKLAEAYDMEINPPPRPSFILRCRYAYEQLLQETEEGTVRMVSCSVNQSAGEDEDIGGYFTSSLISAARKWATSKTDGKTPRSVLRVDQVFRRAEPTTFEMNPPQTPVLREGRRQVSFPFALA